MNLSRAAINGNYNAIQRLGNDNIDDLCGGRTALMYACSYCNERCVETLIKMGAGVDVMDKNGDTALIHVCVISRFYTIHDSPFKCAQLLIKNGADVNHANRRGFTPLIIACQKGGARVTKLLLDQGADMNRVDNNGLTALMHACKHDYSDCAKVLLDYGININAKDNAGYTALRYAFMSNANATILLLLQYHEINFEGIEINALSDVNKCILLEYMEDPDEWRRKNSQKKIEQLNA